MLILSKPITWKAVAFPIPSVDPVTTEKHRSDVMQVTVCLLVVLVFNLHTSLRILLTWPLAEFAEIRISRKYIQTTAFYYLQYNLDDEIQRSKNANILKNWTIHFEEALSFNRCAKPITTGSEMYTLVLCYMVQRCW